MSSRLVKSQAQRAEPALLGTGARNSPVRSACSGHGASTPAKAISEATLKRISDIAVNTVGMERVGVRRQHKALGENKQAVGKQ